MTIDEAFQIIYEKEDIQGGHDEWWEAIRKIQNNLEVLEILREKNVSINLIRMSNNYIVYNSFVSSLFLLSCDLGLREKEFNLIKEWLDYDNKTDRK